MATATFIPYAPTLRVGDAIRNVARSYLRTSRTGIRNPVCSLTRKNEFSLRTKRDRFINETIQSGFRTTRAVASADENATSTDNEVFVSFKESKLMFPYPEASSYDAEIFLSKHKSPSEVKTALAEYVKKVSNEAIAARGEFTIALSGGSLLGLLSGLTEPTFSKGINWERWHVFWVDERAVKLDHKDSNCGAAMSALLSKVPIPPEQLYPIAEDLESLDEVADDYEQLLRELVEDGLFSCTSGERFPRFDLVLLGLGPEGHTASLFPNSPLLANESAWILPVFNSPKPPPKRTTFTLPLINSARNIAFPITGKGKAEVVQRVLEHHALPGSLPAQLVRPYKGSLTWFLDEGAASALKTL